MGIESAPGRAKRLMKYQRYEERRWAAKAGPVTVRRLDENGQEKSSTTNKPDENADE